MRLLVVLGSLPYISLTNPSKRRIHAQPPGPGLPTHAPSVVMTTLCAIVWASRAFVGMLVAVGSQGAARSTFNSGRRPGCSGLLPRRFLRQPAPHSTGF